MKKQGRTLLIMAAVLAVLAAGYFFLVRYNQNRQEQVLDRAEGEELVNIAKEDILRFSYVYNGETYTFIRTEVTVAPQEDGEASDASGALSGEASDASGTLNGEGDDINGTQAGDTGGEQAGNEQAQPQVESRWVSETDPSLNLMQSRLDTMVGKFTHIVAQSTITDVTDLSQYGLEEPSNVLHWETGQGAYTYNVGDYNSFGNVYYICEPGSDTVYAVTASLGTGFGYGLEELVEEET